VFGLGDMSASRDHKLDLMMAAAVGVAAGVTLTLLLRDESHGMFSGMDSTRRRLRRVGSASMDSLRSARKSAVKGARRGMKRGRELIDEIPMEEFGEELRHYLDAAKGAIEDTIKDELHDLRKTMRRRRKRMGIF
jgi:hypothetical protein